MTTLTLNYSRILVMLISVLTTLSITSCIKDALPNIEADIVSVENSSENFFLEPKVTNREVKLFLNKEIADITAFPFQFTLSRGATSTPASGTPQDFSRPVEYLVSSENGEFSKTYTVTATDEKASFAPSFFDFENYKIDDQYKYTTFFDLQNTQPIDTWDSGNAGFVLSISPLVKKEPKLYPTQFTEQAHAGKYAVKLETKSTGVFGAGVKKPIAAGNIFLGSFDSGNVMGDPLKSTMFGLPFDKKPASIEGYYHYTPGAKVIDENSKPSTEKEAGSIIAVFFDADALFQRTGTYFLDGVNLLTDKSIIATAELYDENKTEGDAYKHFQIPFTYLSEFDEQDLNSGRFKIAIVLSSSKNGDRFVGAVGSVLLVDDLKINTQ